MTTEPVVARGRRRRPRPAGASRLIVAGASGAATIALVAAFAEPPADPTPAPRLAVEASPPVTPTDTAPAAGVDAPAPAPTVVPTTAPPVTQTSAS